MNHIDGVKHHNELANVEWATPRQNMEHARAQGLINPPRGEGHPRVVLSDAQVAEIRSSVGSVRKAASHFGVHHSVIWKIRNGRARLAVSA